VRIAVPTVEGKLSEHFGRCDVFEFFNVDSDAGSVTGRSSERPPAHEPGAFPRWLAEVGCTVVIAGGMGRRARGLFEQNGIEVVAGAQSDDPQAAVEAYLSGSLTSTGGDCGH
jgi:predicted Fe-Mo cluster-binding NifX family protein